MATRTKDFNVTRDPSVISKQLVYTDSNENGSLDIPADYFGSKEELDSKFVTFYYGLNDEDYPDSTYEEVERQYSQNQKGLRLKTFVAAESVFLYGVMRWNGSKITFSEVIHGELIEATIDRYSNKWEFTRRKVAFKNELDAESTARENADTELDVKIDAEKTAREEGDTALENKIDSKRAVFYARDYEDDEGNPPTTMAELQAAYERGDDLKFIYSKGGSTYIVPFSAKFGNGFLFSGVTDRMELLKAFVINDEWVKDSRYLVDSEDLDTVLNDLRDKDNYLEGKIDAEKQRAEGAERELEAGKANVVHSHSISDVNGLQNFMDDVFNQIVSEADQRRTKDLEIEGVLNTKANASDVNTALNGKADKSTTYTKTEVDNKVSPKADKTYVDNMLGNVEALLAAL